MVLGVFARPCPTGGYRPGGVSCGGTSYRCHLDAQFYGSFMCIATHHQRLSVGAPEVTRVCSASLIVLMIATLIACLAQHSFSVHISSRSASCFLLWRSYALELRSTWWITTASPVSVMTCRRWPVNGLPRPLEPASVYVFVLRLQLPFISTKFFRLVAALRG